MIRPCLFPRTPLALLFLATLSSAIGFFEDAADAKTDPAKAAREASDTGAASLPRVDLMIVVPSHTTRDADTRSAIRKTWAQYLNKTAVNCSQCESHDVRILFVVGKEGNATEIQAEVKEFDDMGVLEDFAQPEHGGDAEMTQRSIRYALEHFQFKLLLKVDATTWVFMDRLLSFLDGKHLFDMNASMPGIYAGNFAGPQEPALRDDDSLDNVFVALSGSSFYPVYAKGAGFVLSPDLCEFIAGMGAATEDTSGAPKWGAEYGWAPVPRLASLSEDEVSVGFWLLPVNHTKVQMPVAFSNQACSRDDLGASRLVLDNHVDAHRMMERWRNFLETGDVCKTNEQATSSFLKRNRGSL